MHGRKRVSRQGGPRTGEARRVDMVVRAGAGVGLTRWLVVVRVVRRANARVVGMLLKLYKGGLGRGYRGDVARGPGVLVVGRPVPGAQQVVVMALQSVPCCHRRRCRGVGSSCTPARSERAPEIRVIQRGWFAVTLGAEVLQGRSAGSRHSK